jgi:hypothetical protein
MDSIEREEQARQRFMLLSVMRFFGVGLVGVGVAILSGNFFADIPEIVGYVLLLVGVIDFFLAPLILKKTWQGQDSRPN